MCEEVEVGRPAVLLPGWGPMPISALFAGWLGAGVLLDPPVGTLIPLDPHVQPAAAL